MAMFKLKNKMCAVCGFKGSDIAVKNHIKKYHKDVINKIMSEQNKK